MAIHLDQDNFGKLIDPCGGENDIEKKLIRILHEKSFTDDATRVLRSIRYEQRFDFQLEANTETLLHRDLAMLKTISGDRIRHELELILKEDLPEKMLQRAGELGVLKEIHPSLHGNGLLKEVFQQARSTTRSPAIALYFSLMLYYFSHEEGEDFIARLRLPRSIARAIRDTLDLKENIFFLSTAQLSPSDIYELLESHHPLSILANAIYSDSVLQRKRLYLYLNKLRFVKTALDGEALQQIGIPPGPRMGEILRELHEARLDQRVKSREEEEKLVRQWIKRQTR